MLLKVHPDNPNPHEIDMAVEHLKKGDVIIYPTDTVYALGCDIYNQKAVSKICTIKGINPKKAHFSFICHDLSHISTFTKNVDTPTYKLMKKCLPGPFTFILNANSQVPKLFKSNKKTVGIRIPENNIALDIVKKLGNPIMSTSIHDTDKVLAYPTDPEVIYERFKNVVDITIDGGYGTNEVSTVIDCTSSEPVVIRQGKGDIE